MTTEVASPVESQNQRNCCPTCGKAIAKPRRGLTSVEYRRLVRGIVSFQDMRDCKDKLVAIIKNVSRNRDYTRRFESLLDIYVTESDRESGPLEAVKKWLHEMIDALPPNSGEKELYQFLRTGYPEGIDEPFAVFYEKYKASEGTMNKNYVSRALSAIGIRSKMSRVKATNSSGVRYLKSTMVLQVSEEELRDTFSQIGY